MGITLREDPQRRSTEKINKEDPLRRSTEKISREDQERKALEKTMKLLQAAIIAILASGTLAGKLTAPATTAIYQDEQQGTVGEREASDYIDEPADYQDEASKKSNGYDVYDTNPVTDIPKHQSGILEDFQPEKRAMVMMFMTPILLQTSLNTNLEFWKTFSQQITSLHMMTFFHMKKEPLKLSPISRMNLH